MTEATRLEIVQRRQQGASARLIATELGISRGSVNRVLARVEAARTGSTERTPPRRRVSIIDAFEPILKELLDRYPNLTGERALQELRARGFTGHYTIVRERIKRLRPRSAPPPVPRFETEPADQAQMDHGVYDIDFVREGRRRVYLFSYLLGYSRRQYLRFVESMDLPTTLREHVNAFHHLGGVARTCLYDNFKAVVVKHDAEGPLYNPKFLAFATHYGFRPQACRVRRPQTKGKVERKFHYAEVSLLNGRTFDSLDHLNDVATQWLAEVADVHVMRDFKESPRDRHERERPHLLPLPLSTFDWSFNPAIPRMQIEALAQGDFIRRKQNVVFVGQSGLGKSRLIQSIGLAACMLEQPVYYTTSGELLEDLTAAMADQTIHNRVRFYARFPLLVIDEFGFDRIERTLCPQAASLWYKIIDARSQERSTALITNIDFSDWAEYLGDAPLAMALLDRVVDGATIVKLKGQSYRVHRPDKPAAK